MSEATATAMAPEVDIDYLELDRVIDEEYEKDPENLIMILQAIQNRYNYLPQVTLAYLSAKIRVPYSKIYEVATFYSTFSLKPRGRHIISLCLGTACHVRGAERIRERLTTTLGIGDGQTSDDKRFTLETVRCIGCCSLGPVVKIDEDMHARLASDQVGKILEQYE
ncbi:MAG: NADH-quinone oxidoreductase subunit NuoE [Pseudomonadota bacterium]